MKTVIITQVATIVVVVLLVPFLSFGQLCIGVALFYHINITKVPGLCLIFRVLDLWMRLKVFIVHCKVGRCLVVLVITQGCDMILFD